MLLLVEKEKNNRSKVSKEVVEVNLVKPPHNTSDIGWWLGLGSKVFHQRISELAAAVRRSKQTANHDGQLFQ